MALTRERKPFDINEHPDYPPDWGREPFFVRPETLREVLSDTSGTGDDEYVIFLADRDYTTIDALSYRIDVGDDQLSSDAVGQIASDALGAVNIRHFSANQQHGEPRDETAVAGTLLGTVEAEPTNGYATIDLRDSDGLAPTIEQGDYLVLEITGNQTNVRQITGVIRYTTNIGQ